MAWKPFAILSRSDTETAPAAADSAAVGGQRSDILALKEQALATAKGAGGEVNLTDYFVQAIGLLHDVEPPLGADGKPQTLAQMLGDFSGMKLDGITIRRDDIKIPGDDRYPPEDSKLAIRGALQQQIGQNKESGVKSLADMYDLDGNGSVDQREIDGFYASMSQSLNFNNVTFTNVTFQPATTLQILESAQGAQYGNVTLNGLQEGETLQLGSGRAKDANNPYGERFHNVTLINAEGGTVEVNTNATVYGLNMSGGEATLAVKSGGQVNDLRVADAESIHLDLEKGAIMARTRFSGTMDPQSQLEGSVWRGGDQLQQFEGATLANVNFARTTMDGMHFSRSDMEGASFAGASLRNTSFKDTDLSRVDFTGAQIHNVTIERHGITTRVDSVEQLQTLVAMQSQAANIGLGMTSFSGLAANAPVMPVSPPKLEPEVQHAQQTRFDVANASTTALGSMAAPAADTQDARTAMAEALAARAAQAMEGYNRG